MLLVPVNCMREPHACLSQTFLQVLLLARNRIGDKRMGALARAVGRHRALRCLDLSCNAIRFPGACHLAEAVRESATLQKLSLAGNKLRADGVFRLAHVAIGHASMAVLDLRGVELRKADRLKLDGRTRYTRLTFLIDQGAEADRGAWQGRGGATAPGGGGMVMEDECAPPLPPPLPPPPLPPPPPPPAVPASDGAIGSDETPSKLSVAAWLARVGKADVALY
jgi:hypothetical protein